MADDPTRYDTAISLAPVDESKNLRDSRAEALARIDAPQHTTAKEVWSTMSAHMSIHMSTYGRWVLIAICYRHVRL